MTVYQLVVGGEMKMRHDIIERKAGNLDCTLGRSVLKAVK